MARTSRSEYSERIVTGALLGMSCCPMERTSAESSSGQASRGGIGNTRRMRAWGPSNRKRGKPSVGYGLTRTPFPPGRFAIPSKGALEVLPEVCPRSQGSTQPRRRMRSSAIDTLRSTIGLIAPITPQRLPRIECCSPAKPRRKPRGTTGRGIVREGSLAPLVSPASGVCGAFVSCWI